MKRGEGRGEEEGEREGGIRIKKMSAGLTPQK